jgi:hypothetical protein
MSNIILLGEYKELEEFLGELKLMKYKDNFLDNGVEDMETVLGIRIRFKLSRIE